MNYGNTFEEVSKINHPEKEVTDYGYIVRAIKEPEFSVDQVRVRKGEWTFPMGYGDKKDDAVWFVESGRLTLKGGPEEVSLISGEVLRFPPHLNHRLFAGEDTLAYVFFGEDDKRSRNVDIGKTFDVREKYWGRIESIVSGEYAGKRIFMKEGGQSSLEYHVHKKEVYFLQSGKLKVGLRVGRAENRSVILSPGDVFVIEPGTMHMRMALEDSVIIEASTRDDDKDSHIVEDGKSYIHNENDQYSK